MTGREAPTAELSGTAGYLARWRPSSVTPQAACFARQVVAAVAPPGRERAKNLLWAAGRLADWAIGLGLEPVPQVQLHPADLPLPRERAKVPYSPAEIDGYLALADAQPTAARRMRAAGLVCLGAGAGLIRADLRAVRGGDVACRPGGVIVTVRGARARAVPVLARYHEVLLASAGFAGEDLVTGGTDPARHNITNPLARSLAGGTGLPALEGSRLRATWLADCARLLGLATFMAAAGITCSQRLGDIIAGLQPGGEEQAVALLSGQR